MAGVTLGLAGCLKYTGLYVVAAVMLSWLILQREHRGHRIMVAAAAGMIIFDQVVLFFWWGHPYAFPDAIPDSARSGYSVFRWHGNVSRCADSSPIPAVSCLHSQLPDSARGDDYRGAIPVWCYRQRDWVPVQHQAVLFSWAAMGIVTLGLSNLRFPQYFALVLVPLYLLVWTEVWNMRRPFRWWLAGAAAAAGLASFWLSTNAQSVNPLQKVQQYAAAHIPVRAEVVADEQVGDLLRQPYCREQQAGACLRHATYAITWNTYLQKTAQLGDSAYKVEMKGARRLWSSGGFNGTATVWKLDSQAGPSPGDRRRSRPLLLGSESSVVRAQARGLHPRPPPREHHGDRLGFLRSIVRV